MTLGLKDEVAALKRERTLSAAVELFYERGYENTTLDAVGERLGVTKPFIYAHFGSKSELLSEICGRGISSSLDAITQVLASDASPVAKLDLLGQRFVQSVLENQKHIAIFAREEKNLAAEDFERISDMRREFDRKLNELLEQGVAAGEFRVEDTSIAALAIGGLVSWAYVWYRPNGRLSLPALGRQISDLILKMVGAEREKRPTRVRAAR